MTKSYEVSIVGGGPAGLNAALALGRARRRTLLVDGGPPRNAAAVELHTFVTRDGTPPREFRRLARQELQTYNNVTVQDAAVQAVTRQGDGFVADLGGESITVRRVLLAVGVVDILPDLPGYRELWGRSVFQCPYCHGWEVRDRPLGVLALQLPLLEMAFLLTNWSRDIVVFTDGRYPVSEAMSQRLTRAGIALQQLPVRGLVGPEGHLTGVALEGGEVVRCEALVARPAQRQTELVQGLELKLDEQGFVSVDGQHRTSVPGIYAAGDLTTPIQSAIGAAAAGVFAAAMLNHALTLEDCDGPR